MSCGGYRGRTYTDFNGTNLEEFMSTEPENGTVAPSQALVPLQRETILPSSDRGRLAAIVATCSLAGLAGGMALSMLAETHRMMEQTRDLRRHHHAHREPLTWLGVGGLKDLHRSRCEGTRIGEVVPGSPAAREGFRSRDVIIAFGEDRICNSDALVHVVRASSVGAIPDVTIRRGATELTLKPRLGVMPDSIRRQLSR
jgi:hypothetical protein